MHRRLRTAWITLAAGVLVVVAGAIGLGLSASSYLDANAGATPGSDVTPGTGVVIGLIASAGALLTGVALGMAGIAVLVLTLRASRAAARTLSAEPDGPA